MRSTASIVGLTLSGRHVGWFGTVARLAGAGALIFLAVADNNGVQWWDAAMGLALFPLITKVVVLVRLQITRDPLQATSGLWFLLSTGVIVALFAVSATRDAAALFYGSSLFLAAVRGYAGCEVLAISNWILRRDDQVGCFLFSPIDQLEARVRGKAKATR